MGQTSSDHAWFLCRFTSPRSLTESRFCIFFRRLSLKRNISEHASSQPAPKKRNFHSLLWSVSLRLVDTICSPQWGIFGSFLLCGLAFSNQWLRLFSICRLTLVPTILVQDGGNPRVMHEVLRTVSSMFGQMHTPSEMSVGTLQNFREKSLTNKILCASNFAQCVSNANFVFVILVDYLHCKKSVCTITMLQFTKPFWIPIYRFSLGGQLLSAQRCSGWHSRQENKK